MGVIDDEMLVESSDQGRSRSEGRAFLQNQVDIAKCRGLGWRFLEFEVTLPLELFSGQI